VAVGFEWRGELIGTIRAVPMQFGLTLVEKLLGPDITLPPGALKHSWELSRLVIDPGCRAGPDLLRCCLHLGLSFLSSHAPVGNLFGACTPPLARLYQRFGYEVVARNVPLPGHPRTYWLVHGPMARVMAAVSGAHPQKISTTTIQKENHHGP